ncbi:hypothetical protein SNE40_006544 [Patella caerulea]|uniref:Tesmin/TSO1-like CXC domain-containing protein n=1 Tax=Patella caerulea TaxID=87958 RepID=A0AAN8Q6C0_PATCE
MANVEDFQPECVVCGEGGGSVELAKVFATGLRTLVKSADVRKDDQVKKRIESSAVPHVHNECRRKYNDKRQLSGLEKSIDPIPAKLRRSSVPAFDWKENCFICSESAFVDVRHPDRTTVHRVETLDFGPKILEMCGSMHLEPIAIRIRETDLVAVEARYHQKCHLGLINAEKKRHVPAGTREEKEHNFLLLCSWLENYGELECYSIPDLYTKMEDLSSNGEIYAEKYLKQKLEEHYGDHVFFAHGQGSRKDVLCLRNMAEFFISDKWYKERREHPDDEARRIIGLAAKLIREEIRAMPYNKDEYPSLDQYQIDECQQHVCALLRLFLSYLIQDELKAVSLGHLITQNARPRSVISPVPFGVGVELHHVFGSEWVIKQFHALGLSVSYDEVTRFRQSVMQEQTLDTLSPPEYPVLSQYGGDNADSNIRTLSGSGTFHAMAHYAWFRSPPDQNTPRSSRVKRLARVQVTDLVKNKGIPIMSYINATVPSRTIITPLDQSAFDLLFPIKPYYSMLLWKSTLFLRSTSNLVLEWTNWSGFMRKVYRKEDNEKDETILLPIIDQNPNDEDCVYSTLCYISEQASRLKLPSTSVTFDQPLFLKAFEIAETKGLSRLVIRLGGFHLLMSALGSLYATMKGSGIDEAIAQVFATNTVPMILSGKAFSRCIRATHLVNAALHNVLLRNLADTEDETISSMFEDLLRLVEEVKSPQCEDPLTTISQSPALAKLENYIASAKETLISKSRTAKLWWQFIDYVDVIDMFIVSERAKYWHGHISACYKLLNLFAATGHSNYAKCTRLYLQRMIRLELDHPWLYKKYVEDGCFAVQRSNHPFNGLWSDLVIEQVVMASLKNSRSGLTHGRGLTESVRQQWVYCLPLYAAFHDAMCQMTGTHRETSEQHVETGETRRKTDVTDAEKLCEWFTERDPFTDNPELRSLSTGITASDSDSVNCDDCEAIGQGIQNKLDNLPYDQAKLSRKDTIRTLQDLESGITIGKKNLNIEPRILFSRLSAIARRQDTDVEPFLEFEMAISPPSLFDGETMRKTDKSELSRQLLSVVVPVPLPSPINATLIIDGGWLLHRVRWSKNQSYHQITDVYITFLQKFGPATIIFDGYGEPSTKDHEHRLRQAKSMSATIEVQLNRRCLNKQEQFLTNEKNKSQFIAILSTRLRAAGHTVAQASADADTMIVNSALNASKQREVVLMAEDTDILVMIVYHFEPAMHDIKLCKFPKKQKDGLLYSIRSLFDCLDPITKNHILFVHAWSGCDTTSATFGQGKLGVLNLLRRDEDLVQCAKVFQSTKNQDHQLITETGEKVFSRMYGSKERLNRVRYQKYLNREDDPVNLDPRKLPPTTRAAHFHSLRVFLQVQDWLTLGDRGLDPSDWGWCLKSGLYTPVKTDNEIAPAIVLKSVRCKCKSKTQERQCATNVCSCRKFGLKCVPACGGCRGESCKNTETPIVEEL